MPAKLFYKSNDYEDIDIDIQIVIQNDCLETAFAKFLILAKYMGYSPQSWEELICRLQLPSAYREMVAEGKCDSLYDWAEEVVSLSDGQIERRRGCRLQNV